MVGWAKLFALLLQRRQPPDDNYDSANGSGKMHHHVLRQTATPPTLIISTAPNAADTRGLLTLAAKLGFKFVCVDNSYFAISCLIMYY